MAELRQRQIEFMRRVPLLIQRAFALGYEVTGGDLFRDARCRYGAAKSLHKLRLAIDLNLFRDGRYLERTEDHRPLGEWWESIGGVWGGRFDDGNHYQAPDGAWSD